MNRLFKTFLLAVLVLLLIGLSFSSGLYVSQRYSMAHPFLSPPKEVPQSLDTVWQAWELISNNYVNKQAVDAKKLRQGAIKGIVEALQDPYTSYLDAETARLEVSQLQGKFEGIGASVETKDKQLIVVAPIPDSPAEKAGIRPGDAILQIDGQPTAGLSLQEAVLRIRGPKGTLVTLLIRHQGQSQTEQITIVRAEIQLKSVRWQPKEEMAYLQISHFTGSTSQELRRALSEISSQRLRGIVLDLRANPGGLLSEVVAIASQFLPEGATVVRVVNNRGEAEEFKVSGGGRDTAIPLAVLVDNFSASGSEVLAGALQDYGRAPIIGTKTFGKGSVNVLFPLKDGSGLYLTTSRWLTPKGRLIEGQGLTPDTEVAVKAEERLQGQDPALEQALEYLRSRLSVAVPSSQPGVW